MANEIISSGLLMGGTPNSFKSNADLKEPQKVELNSELIAAVTQN